MGTHRVMRCVVSCARGSDPQASHLVGCGRPAVSNRDPARRNQASLSAPRPRPAEERMVLAEAEAEARGFGGSFPGCSALLVGIDCAAPARRSRSPRPPAAFKKSPNGGGGRFPERRRWHCVSARSSAPRAAAAA